MRINHKTPEAKLTSDATDGDDKYKYFFQSSIDLACFANLEGYFEELNDTFTEVLGYTQQDLLDRKFIEFIHPDDIAATLQVMTNLSLGISAINFINRYRTKSNTYRYLDWNASVDTKTGKIYAIARDVTESIHANQRQADQSREKESQEIELRAAIKELASQNEEKANRAKELGIANVELALQNRQKEQRAKELIVANYELAYLNEEKEKRASELIIANTELAFQNEEKEKRAQELIIANKELAFQNEEKEKRAQELIVANKELDFQNEEKRKRAIELLTANAEIKKAEEDIRMLNDDLEHKVVLRTAQLEFANTELESFSYSVSHDLRAPLRAISGNANILMEEFNDKFGDDTKGYLASIIRNSRKMGMLIDDLLAFSKLGRKQVAVSDMNVNAMVQSICESLGLNDAAIEFKMEVLPPAKGDPALIKQVWINLISNAIKYSKNNEKTCIEIGSYEKDNDIVYYVKDNGAGFDMQYYDKLFGVFQRLHSQEEFEGTGIGLAIVQKIVKRHHGTVWAKSKLGEGASFYFSLPSTKILN